MAERVKYPFHIGITEAGIGEYGIIKSAVGCGIITFLGLADTVRVSLTAPSKDEVIVAYQILKSLGLREYGPEVISCPTCGRAKIDLIKVVEYFNKELQRRYSSRILKEIRAFKIALMGCEVNGPGEASFADIGVAFGRDRGYLFKFGKIIEKGSLEEILKALLREVDKLIVVGRRDEG
jgi:(E)-4-hydroxy-3-methylbut-2-enyl-diphosphate synthase